MGTTLPKELPTLLKKAHREENRDEINRLLQKHTLVDVEDHTFVDCIKSSFNVLDLGGWRGNFAEKINSIYGCNVYVVEPNRNQVEVLEKRFSNNKKVTFLPFAVGGESGSVTFYPSPEGYPGDEKGSSLNAESPYVNESHSYQVEKKSLSELPALCGVKYFDFIKMDIEGAEEEVFDNPECVKLMQHAKVLSIEFHHKMPVNGQILISENKIKKMIAQLTELGFEFVDFGRDFKYIDCLFYKKNDEK